MGATKLTTLIVNATEQPLTMKVGNRNCFSRLASVKKGGDFVMHLCMDWTYQEFMLEDKTSTSGDAARGKKLFVSSDDPCDYERITVSESGSGKLVVDRVPRKQQRRSQCVVQQQIPSSTFRGKLTSWRFWL